MQTRSQKKIASDLQKVLDADPITHKVENRYNTLRAALRDKYPDLVANTDKTQMLDFLKDVVYLDRKLRQLTEGEEENLKQVLSEEAQVELGYHADHKQEVSKLQTL